MKAAISLKSSHLDKLHALLPNGLFDSKDYNASGLVGRVEYLLSSLKDKNEEIKQLEEFLIEAKEAKKEKRYDVKEPNFRDGKGNLFLVRCPACHKENYAQNVSRGQCSLCAWKDGDEY